MVRAKLTLIPCCIGRYWRWYPVTRCYAMAAINVLLRDLAIELYTLDIIAVIVFADSNIYGAVDLCAEHVNLTLRVMFRL